MSQGEKGVIHTLSSFTQGLTLEIQVQGENGLVSVGNSSQADIDYAYSKAYEYLVEQEVLFYSQIFKGETWTNDSMANYNKFLQLYRDKLKEREEDLRYLRRLANENLNSLLPNPKPSVLEQHYKILLEGQVLDIANEWKINNPGVKIDIVKGKYLEITNNKDMVWLMKTIINKLEKKTGWTAFKQESGVTTNFTNRLIEIIETDARNVYNIDITDAPKNNKLQKAELTLAEQITQEKFNKKIWQNIRNEGGEEWEKLQNEVKEATKIMHDFIYSGLPYDKEQRMKNAVDRTWKEYHLDGTVEDILTYSPFFEGLNYNKAIRGGLGEFANKVWILYVNSFGGQDIIVNAIGGGNLSGAEEKLSQQPRSDLEIILACGGKIADAGSIGFQTKNIDQGTEIKTNTTPELIESHFPGVSSVLVNKFSHTEKIAILEEQTKKFKEALKDYFFYAMNLNVSEDLKKFSEQTNTFYFIRGKHLVPGSRIISYFKEGKMSGGIKQFNITGGGVKAYSDKDYRENFKEFGFWEYPEGSNPSSPADMIATIKNRSAFSSAASKISIGTSFSLGNNFLTTTERVAGEKIKKELFNVLEF